MNLPVCPLCDNESTAIVEEIPLGTLTALYKSFLGRDVEEEFAGVPSERLELRLCAQCDLRFFYPPVVGSERLYELLQRFEWYYQDDKPEYAVAARFITSEDSVLEIGCGKGAFANRIAPARYVGLELSTRARRTAAANGLDVRSEFLSAHAATHRGTYSVVAAFQVLEHVASPGELIADALSCLAAGGRLILSVPSDESYIRHGQNYLVNMPPHHQTRWTDRALRAVAGLFELELLSLEHDSLSDAHTQDYSFVMADLALARVLGLRPRSVDVSLAARCRRRVSRLLCSALRKAVAEPAFRPMGHSVTAVYRAGGASK